MRISVKGRYALVSLMYMALMPDNNISAASIADRFGLSKMYLEQVCSLLKKAGLINSVKGARGGYSLTRAAAEITVYDILLPCETQIFEPTQSTVSGSAPQIESIINNYIFKPLDDTVLKLLKKVTLKELIEKTEKDKNSNFMFYI